MGGFAWGRHARQCVDERVTRRRWKSRLKHSFPNLVMIQVQWKRILVGSSSYRKAYSLAGESTLHMQIGNRPVAEKRRTGNKLHEFSKIKCLLLLGLTNRIHECLVSFAQFQYYDYIFNIVIPSNNLFCKNSNSISHHSSQHMHVCKLRRHKCRAMDTWA